MSLAYGDQGRLSLAEAVRPPGGATAGGPVSFVADQTRRSVYRVRERLRRPGAGGCEFDADGDGAIDYLCSTWRHAGGAQRCGSL